MIGGDVESLVGWLVHHKGHGSSHPGCLVKESTTMLGSSAYKVVNLESGNWGVYLASEMLGLFELKRKVANVRVPLTGEESG